MKILILSSSYLPRKGGVETATSQHARYFREIGHTVKVVTQRYPKNLKSYEIINGIEIHRLLFFNPHFSYAGIRSMLVYIFLLFLSPFTLLQFLFEIIKFNPDIINYQFVGAPTFFLLFYLKLFKHRLVVTLQGDDVRTLPFKSKISMSLFKTLLKKADFITANSSYLLGKALEIAPFIKNKSEVIYNGINLEEFKYAVPYNYNGKYILSVGRLVYTKGYDILVEAFDSVVKEMDGIDLIIAGDGPQRENLEKLIEEFKLRDRVRLYGGADRDEIIRLLKGCELYVLPSREEAFGIAILEAMACKKIVVATRSGGPEEIVEEGINGLLVEKERPHKLAETMIRLLKDDGLREKILENLDKPLDRFDVKTTGRQYLDIFKRCG